MLDLLVDPHAWAALVTLTVLEIVLGIDNVVFISILVSRCEPKQAKRARQIGLSLAFIFRIVMLFGLTWLMKLTAPLFSLFGMGISWRDLILIGGGLFLIAKATHEIHNEVEAQATARERPHGGVAIVLPGGAATHRGRPDLLARIRSSPPSAWCDDIEIMIAAVLHRHGGDVSRRRVRSRRFIAEHPTTKMLALAFLVLIGMALVADGFEFHIPRGYIYFAMAFAGAVEAFNVLAGRNRSARRARTNTGEPDACPSDHRRRPRHRRGNREARRGARL